jgi:disulfide bond formation protein DsbB
VKRPETPEASIKNASIRRFIVNYASYLIFLIVLLSMLTSLLLSGVLHWAPCILCWYQRILMFPLVVISVVGIIRKDRNLPVYILSLSLLGVATALYHSLLQVGIIPEQLTPCQVGASCAVRHFAYLGFITVPFLSLLSFSAVSILAILKLSLDKQSK